jgi:hypothetical protein
VGIREGGRRERGERDRETEREWEEKERANHAVKSEQPKLAADLDLDIQPVILEVILVLQARALSPSV